MPPSMRNPGRKVEPIHKEVESPPLDYFHFGGSEGIEQHMHGTAITPSDETCEASDAIVTKFLRCNIDLLYILNFPQIVTR